MIWPTSEQLEHLDELQRRLDETVPEYEAVWNPESGKIVVRGLRVDRASFPTLRLIHEAMRQCGEPMMSAGFDDWLEYNLAKYGLVREDRLCTQCPAARCPDCPISFMTA